MTILISGSSRKILRFGYIGPTLQCGNNGLEPYNALVPTHFVFLIYFTY